MELAAVQADVLTSDADAVAVGVFSGGELTGAAASINKAAGGVIGKLLESGDFKAKPYETLSLWSPAGVKSPQVLLVGLGKRDEFDRGTAYRAASAAMKQLTGRQRKRVELFLDDNWTAEQLEAGIAGSLVGSVGQDLHRREKKRFAPNRLHWVTTQENAFAQGRIMGEAMNLTRRLVNEPPHDMYPEVFASEAEEMAKVTGLECEVWDFDKLTAEGAESLLAVARGSARPPRLVILRHNGGAAGQPPLALVGKGVTFDSGGLSLKPSDAMLSMKCDMAGAATMLGAMQAIARLKLPVNVIGLAGLVENMPSGTAMKLGDVLRARSGKTIEVHNTDAEGRLVLADVLNVAVQNKPARIIDLATLTGSCMVALGNDVAGLMGNDQAWLETVLSAANDCGERLWQLPMFPEYGEQIRSEVADIKNVGEGRWGGAITAAKFLEEFVEGLPWAHFDIAGPAFYDKPRGWQDAGASGIFVRTLVEIARGFKP